MMDALRAMLSGLAAAAGVVSVWTARTAASPPAGRRRFAATSLSAFG